MKRLALLASAWLVFSLQPDPAPAQEPVTDTTAQALAVFLDCNAHNCDFDHFRREITWVNWMRDREDADLHLLITAERTGGGGWQYRLDYLGRRSLEELEKSLGYTSDPDDTDAEVRDGLTRTLALGLVQFVENTAMAPRLRVVFEQPEAVVVEREEDDPWNLWVFRLGVEGSIEGEAQERAYSLEGWASADRVSEGLKLNFGTSVEYDREEYDELEEGETYVNISEDYSASFLAVWSLTNHWSLGGKTSASRSTYFNHDLAVSVGPAVEYNIFPYQESTRRSITFGYAVEAAAFDYELETVERKTDEILLRHTALVAAAVQQPWGEVFGSVEAIQYFHDLGAHRINTRLSVEYRLFRGFGLDVFAAYARIKDQFFLPGEGLTDAEILLQRRQRETGHRFDIGVGFSYRFGSSFANIVNPRMSEVDIH